MRRFVAGGGPGGFSFPIVTGAYTGPGDIISGAVGWWGLRAYSAASIGSNVVNIRRSSDNSNKTFVSLANGGINTSDPFFDGSNYFVTTLYDQSGNGNNFVQATGAAQPTFTLGVLGGGSLPAMGFNSSTGLNVQATVTVTQPFTFSVVSERTANFTTLEVFWVETSGNNFQLAYSSAVNTARMFFGASVTGSPTDSAFHSIHAVVNGASSDFRIDQVSNPGNSGAGNPGSGWILGVTSDNNFTEFGAWVSAFSSATANAVASNQKTYWVF